MKKALTGWGCFGILVYSLAVVVASAVVGGLVLSQLWSWFMVPTFGLSALTVPAAAGLQLVVGLFLSGLKRESFDEGATVAVMLFTATARIVLNAALFLVFGWIIQSFM